MAAPQTHGFGHRAGPDRGTGDHAGALALAPATPRRQRTRSARGGTEGTSSTISTWITPSEELRRRQRAALIRICSQKSRNQNVRISAVRNGLCDNVSPSLLMSFSSHGQVIFGTNSEPKRVSLARVAPIAPVRPPFPRPSPSSVQTRSASLPGRDALQPSLCELRRTNLRVPVELRPAKPGPWLEENEGLLWA
jgi:hypothetical protein